MNIEQLPNELFVNCFKYLSTADLVYAFHGLNCRVDALLLDHFRIQGLDFQSISRTSMDIICQNYLPKIIDQIPSIRLSDDEQSPGLVQHFFKYGFLWHQFTHLQSFSIHRLRSDRLIGQLLIGLQDLPNLTRLIYNPYYLVSNSMVVRHFVSGIWRLSKLTHCYLAFQPQFPTEFPLPFITSASLRYLTIEGMDLGPNEVVQLLGRTPNLQHYSVRVTFQLPFSPQLSFIPQITKLNITYVWQSKSQLISLLKMLPNVCKLKIHLQSSCFYGQQWEEIIRRYIPKLTNLQFYMLHKLRSKNHKEQEIDKVLETFRSDFWLKEHQWFVQCDWNPDEENAYVFTSPYPLDLYRFTSPCLSKRTSADDNNPSFYNNVRSLAYFDAMSNYSVLSTFQFLNLTFLGVTLPINEHFWSLVPHFNQVKLLTISWTNDYEKSRQQLSSLLNCMPRLSKLHVRQSPSSILEVLSVDSKSVSKYYLDLLESQQCYNNEQCRQLIHLLSVLKCKGLAITVENRQCIVDIVNHSSNLLALTVLCQNDQWTYGSQSTNDELVEWLQQHLPSSYNIRRIPGHRNIDLWLR